MDEAHSHCLVNAAKALAYATFLRDLEMLPASDQVAELQVKYAALYEQASKSAHDQLAHADAAR